VVPQVHEKIEDLRSFVETFLYFFSQGSNAEFVSQSKDLFYLMHDRLGDTGVKVHQAIGGHSSVWAKRAQFEGCKVYIAPYPSEFNKERMSVEGASPDLLVLSVDEEAENNPEVNRGKHQDIHLVFEYNKGDEILGYTAPRSNRFYFVHDPNGSLFK
jgi:ADP-dependent phosphofructokinase/glucokinase